MPRAAAALALLLLALSSGSAFAQSSDIQAWSVARVNHGLSEDFAISAFARARLDDNVSEVRDYTLRTYLTWSIVEGVPFFSSLTTSLGYDRLKAYGGGRDEHRIWQTVQHGVDRGRFRFVHRLRLDERFLQEVDPVLFRLRYRLAGTTQLGSSEWYGLGSNETFVNLGEDDEGPRQGFDQTRTRVGFGRWLGDRLRADGGYEFQFVSRRGRDAFRHVFFLELSLATGVNPRAVRSGTEARRKDDEHGG